MAIAFVQASPVVQTSGSSAANTSFGSLPSAVAMITVSIAMVADLGSENVTIADNQGNTYAKAADAGNINDLRGQIWYTYNIGAPGGTFTVTATPTGSNQVTLIQAKEYSGFGASDPITGSATAVGNSIAPAAGPTAPSAAASILVDAVVGSYQTINAVEVVSPVWVSDGTFSGWQTVHRIVTSGSQSVSWTLNGTAVWTACIVAFTDTPLAADARLDQMGRHTLDTAEGMARLDQMARHVLFEFTTCGANPPTPVLMTYPIRRVRRFLLPSSPDNKNVQIPTLELLMRTGIGLTPAAWDGANVPQGANPQVMMRLSKDGGKTWGPERWRSAGAIGRYLTRVRWLRATGNYRNAVVEVVVSDPVDWQFLAMLGDPTEGSS